MTAQTPESKSPPFPTRIILVHSFTWPDFLTMLGVLVASAALIILAFLRNPSHPLTPAQTIELLEIIAAGVVALMGTNILIVFLDYRLSRQRENERNRRLLQIVSKGQPDVRAAVELLLSEGQSTERRGFWQSTVFFVLGAAVGLLPYLLH
jgi:hypothetical protein